MFGFLHKTEVLAFVTGSSAMDATETGEVAQQIVKEPGAAMDTDRWGAILQVNFLTNLMLLPSKYSKVQTKKQKPKLSHCHKRRLIKVLFQRHVDLTVESSQMIWRCMYRHDPYALLSGKHKTQIYL